MMLSEWKGKCSMLLCKHSKSVPVHLCRKIKSVTVCFNRNPDDFTTETEIETFLKNILDEAAGKCE